MLNLDKCRGICSSMTFYNFATATNCDANEEGADYDPSDYNNKRRIIPGARTLDVFMGQSDGGLKLIETNDKIVLDADSGGVWGDPLNGLSLAQRELYAWLCTEVHHGVGAIPTRFNIATTIFLSLDKPTLAIIRLTPTKRLRAQISI